MATKFVPLTVTVQQAVDLTGISRSKLYTLMDENRLRYCKIDGSRRIIFKSLEELILSSEVLAS